MGVSIRRRERAESSRFRFGAMLPAKTAAVFLASLGFASAAQAAWELDNDRSAVQFMSVKNASIAELHHFKALAGGVSDEGDAQLVIDLDSVETLIPIRNERMRELLFETLRYPAATISATVPAELRDLAPGESRSATLALQVALHGVQVPVNASVQVTGLSDGDLQVVLQEPVVIKAADFALGEGVEVLREVAGLASISTAVPVTGALVFRVVK